MPLKKKGRPSRRKRVPCIVERADRSWTGGAGRIEGRLAYTIGPRVLSHATHGSSSHLYSSRRQQMTRRVERYSTSPDAAPRTGLPGGCIRGPAWRRPPATTRTVLLGILRTRSPAGMPRHSFACRKDTRRRRARSAYGPGPSTPPSPCRSRSRRRAPPLLATRAASPRPSALQVRVHSRAPAFFVAVRIL